MREETAAEKEGGLGGRFDEGKRGGEDQCKEKTITLVVEKGGKMVKRSEEERRGKKRNGKKRYRLFSTLSSSFSAFSVCLLVVMLLLEDK